MRSSTTHVAINIPTSKGRKSRNGVPLSSISSISKMITSCQQNNHPAHLLHPPKHALKRLAKPICISFRKMIYCPSTTLSSTQHVSLIHVNAAMRNLLCWVNSRPYLFFKVTLCLRNHQSRFHHPIQSDICHTANTCHQARTWPDVQIW